MRELKLGVTYKTVQGATYTVSRLGVNYDESYCSDGWYRQTRGTRAGQCVSEERHPFYRHHTAWETEVFEPTQLELF